MTGYELSLQLTKHWQEWPNIDIMMSVGDELRPVVAVDYDVEHKRFVMIPEDSKRERD